MILRQAEIARETGISEMTVHRRLRALDRTGNGVSDFDAIAIFASQELEAVGIAGHIAIDLLAEFASELRWLVSLQSRKCWLVFVETDRASFQASAISESHQQALLAAFPMSRVLPLHEVVRRAQERLAGVKARLASVEAA